jgi:hypothetical protein
MNTITLTSKETVSPLTKPVWDEAIPGVYVPNSFEMPGGASTWGRGRFLMLKADYDELFPEGGGRGTLTMTDVTTGTKTYKGSISLEIVAAGYRHVAASTTTAAKVNTDHLIEAVVYDLRSTKLYEGGPTLGFNVVDPTDGTHYTSTQDVGVDWTWTGLVQDALGASFYALDIAPTWTPENLIFDGATTARAIDMLAAILQRVVGFDWTTGDATGITIFEPESSTALNDPLLARAEADYRIGGGISKKAEYRAPSTINFMFRVLPTDQYFPDPFVSTQRWYTKSVFTGISGAVGSSIMPLIVPNVALFTSGALTNTAALDAIAAELATQIIAEYEAEIEEVTYAGLWPFTPDGLIRNILWISDRKGARTVIQKNHSTPYLPWDQGILSYELMQSTRVSGTGFVGSTAGPAGGIVWVSGEGNYVDVCPYP